MGSPDVVDTAQEARGAGAPAAARARAARAVPRRARDRLRAARGRADRRGPLERHLPGPPGRRARRAAPPAAPAAAAVGARRAARGAPAARARGTPVRVPRVLAACDDESVLGRALLPDGGDARERDHHGDPAGARHPGGPAAESPRSSSTGSWRCTRWTGAPAGSRASASRAATSSASCGASPASGSTTRRASCRSCRRSATGSGRNMPESPESTIVHGDYRLGNVDVRRRRPAPPGRDLRLGAVHDRRPARRRRLPHGPPGPRPTIRRTSRTPACRRSPAARASPAASELVARYEERSGRSASRPALVPGARAVEGRGLHGGQLQALHGRLDRRSLPRALRRGRAAAGREGAGSRPTGDEGPAGRLRRRPHHQRLRVVSRILRRRGPRPGRGQAAVPREPRGAAPGAQSRDRGSERGRVRRALRGAARDRAPRPAWSSACSGMPAPTTPWSRP